MSKTFQLEIYSCLCAAKEFTVKGIPADTEDFGEGSDESPETAADYACGNRVWRGKMPTTEVLSKYGITAKEYAEIVSELEESLSFGSCGWCV